MSLSKNDITELIRKRRKKTLYEAIHHLQSSAMEEDDYFRDPRNARFIAHFQINRTWPHHQYIYMREKDVPPNVYRSWFTHYVTTPEGRSHVWVWHPRDHEWLLSQLLE